MGDQQKAISCYEEALKMRRAIYGKSTAHPDIATSLNNLGDAWSQLGDYKKAISYHEQALQILIMIYGQQKDHPLIASALHNLGVAWQNLGDYRKAIGYKEQVLQMRKSVYGQTTAHPHVSESLSSLATVWYNIGDYKKAVKYHEQALEMTIAIFGRGTAHPSIAKSLSNLEGTWCQLGDYRKAISYGKQALDMRMTIYGQGTAHPDIALSLNNLGNLHNDICDLQTALMFCEASLQMSREIYGLTAAHCDIATSLNNIGAIWRDHGNGTKAISYFREALQMYRTVFGPNTEHPLIAKCLVNIAETWAGLGNHSEAVSYCEEALQTFRTIHGQSTPHHDIASALNGLGLSVWCGQQNLCKAVSYLTEALQMFKTIYGQSTPNVGTATTLNNLGILWHDQGDYQKAIGYHEEALQMYRVMYGQIAGHVRIACSLTHLGLGWSDRGNCRKAISYLEDSLQMYKSVYGHDIAHVYIAKTLYHLGSVWRFHDDPQKAISYLNESLQMYRSVCGQTAEHLGIAYTLKQLGLAWEVKGDHHKGIKYHEEALQMYKNIYMNQTQAHPEIASSLTSLGMAWDRAGEYRKAISYHEEALQMFNSVYGQSETRPDTSTALNNLGLSWHHQGDHAKAISYFEQALTILKSTYGHNIGHRDIANILYNLGLVWCEGIGIVPLPLKGTGNVSTRGSWRSEYVAYSQGPQTPAYSRGFAAHVQSPQSVSPRDSVGAADERRPIAYLQGAQSDSLRESVGPADPGPPIAYLQGPRSLPGDSVGPADSGRPKAYLQGAQSDSLCEYVGPADPGRPKAYLQGPRSLPGESVGPTDPGRPKAPKAYTQGPWSAPTGESVGPADPRRRVQYHAQGPWSVSTDGLEESAGPGRPRLHGQGPLSVHAFAAHANTIIPTRKSVRPADPLRPIAYAQGSRRVSTRESVGSTEYGDSRRPKAYTQGPYRVSTGESIGPEDPARARLYDQDSLTVPMRDSVASADPERLAGKAYIQGPWSVPGKTLVSAEPGRPKVYIRRISTPESVGPTDYGDSRRPWSVSTGGSGRPADPGRPIKYLQGAQSDSMRDSVGSADPGRPIKYLQGAQSDSMRDSVGSADPGRPIKYLQGAQSDSMRDSVGSADPGRPKASQGPSSVSTGESVGPADPGRPILYEQRPLSFPTRESGGSADSGAPGGPIAYFQGPSVSTRESVRSNDYGDSRRPRPPRRSLGIQGMNPFAMIRNPVHEKTEEVIRRSRQHEYLRAAPDEPRLFDRNGGHLTLEHLGIDLFVPPDAVPDANTEIFMFAQDVDEPSRDEIEEKWMPPVIQCGPHGLRFNRHVILTVKHPAKDLSEWSFKFQASNTDIGEAPEWKDLTQDPSAMCFTHGDKTVIFVDHFTLFGLVGKLVGTEREQKVKKRRFRMGVFAEPLFQDTEIFQLRVRFWQDNKKEEKAVRKKEQHLQGVQLGDDKVLHLAGDGGNVSVMLEWLYPGWQVMENDRQTIPFSSLWNDHAEMPSCTFGLERQPLDTQPRVSCRVTALQVAHPGNSVSIDVLKQLGSRQTPDGPSAVPLDPESTFLQLQPELHPTPRCVPQFPSEEQFRRLCLELDLENPAGNDWRSVAEALRLPYDFVQWTRQKTDPTRRLLDFLVALHGEDSLRVLRDALAEIGHERALQMVEAMMETADNGQAARAEVQYGATGHQSTDGQPFAGMWHANDMHFGSHCTTPKEAHSLCAYAPKAVRSGMGNVTGNGSRPSDLQQTPSSGPTSSESTTVEKVSGERSLGEGQEADASMPSTWNVASGNISHVSSV
uniref:Death domain-containing protein n=1 Tax=Branchiostoma floridae TaxID=7739 RepID=C3YAL6_BRAFL|eukprot:XP_002606754.1 hypothetical protein BRAFLDRAFT_82395 [Branchiostoma floridae]